jgi:hypothetical protein
MTYLTASLFRRVAHWAGLSLGLNLAWEIAQLPFYVLAGNPGRLGIAYAVVHCTGADAFIAVASFLLAAAALRDPDWPASHPWRGGAIATASGLGYTALSEWYNVYQAGNWAYSVNMPLIFGIGLSPLLQWAALPSTTVLISRALHRNRSI